MSFLKDVLPAISPAAGLAMDKGPWSNILQTLSPAVAMFGSPEGSKSDGPAATGIGKALGGAIGVDPSRIASIADKIGRASNGIAEMGGAAPGYSGMQMAPTNHLQMLDPDALQKLVQQFQGVRYS